MIGAAFGRLLFSAHPFRSLPGDPLQPPPSTAPSSRRGLNPAAFSAPAPPVPASPPPLPPGGAPPESTACPSSPPPRRNPFLLAGPHPHDASRACPSGLHLSTTSSPWRGSLPKAPPTPLQSYLSDTPSSRRGTPQKILSTSCPPLRRPHCQKQTWGPPFGTSRPHPGVFGLFPGFFGYFLGFSGCFLKKVGPKTSFFPPLPV